MKSKFIIITTITTILLMAMLVSCTGVSPTPISPITELSTVTSPTPDSPGTESFINNSYLPEVPRISVEEVKAKMDGGVNMVIVDSRFAQIYELNHIAGAISLPALDMVGPYDYFDGYDEIIFYCL